MTTLNEVLACAFSTFREGHPFFLDDLSISFMLVAIISVSIWAFRALMGSILDGIVYLISVSIPKTLVVNKHLGIFMPGNAGWSLSDQPQKH